MSLRARLVATLLVAVGGRAARRSAASPTRRSARSRTSASTTRRARPRPRSAGQLDEHGVAAGDGGGRARTAAGRRGRGGPRPAAEPAARHLRAAPRRGGHGRSGPWRSSLRSRDDRRAPELPAGLTPGQVITVDAKGGTACATACGPRRRDGTGSHDRRRPAHRVDRRRSPAAARRGARDRRRPARCSALRVVGRSSASGCARSTASGATAGAIAAGDLSRRVEPRRPETEVGRLGLALNGDARPARAARSPSARRARAGCGASSPTPRTSCARRWRRSAATPSCSGSARRASPADTEKAMRRIEEEAARMGVLVEDLLTLARLDEVRDAAARGGRPAPARRGRGRRRARDGPRRARSTLDADDDAIVLGRRRPAAPGAGNLLRNALVHTPAGTPIEIAVGAGGRRRSSSRCATTAPACRPTDPDALFERFWRAEARPRARPRRRRASAWRSSPASSRPTAAASAQPTPPAAERSSSSRCPPRRTPRPRTRRARRPPGAARPEPHPRKLPAGSW